MSEQDNLRLMQEFFEAAQRHDTERIAAMLDESYVMESDGLPGRVTSRKEYVEFLETFYKAFPDTHYEIEQMVASGDYVVVRLRVTGTHRGEFQGIPATNRRFDYHVCHFDQLGGRKILRAWGYWDSATMSRQLGLSQS